MDGGAETRMHILASSRLFRPTSDSSAAGPLGSPLLGLQVTGRGTLLVAVDLQDLHAKDQHVPALDLGAGAPVAVLKMPY